jgi:hypothetical protein
MGPVGVVHRDVPCDRNSDQWTAMSAMSMATKTI